jgi:hypothetical protein
MEIFTDIGNPFVEALKAGDLPFVHGAVGFADS